MKKALITLILIFYPVVVFGQNDYRVGETRRLAWDYPYDMSIVASFHITLNGGTPINVGLPPLPPSSFVWPLPTLPVGNHTASVIACNSNNECGPPLVLTWRVLSPIPTDAPTNGRLIPEDLPISSNQAYEMAESYAYLIRLLRLRPPESRYMIDNFIGPLTYGNVMNYLDSQAHLLIQAR